MDSKALPTIRYGENQEITEYVQSYMTVKGWVPLEVYLPDGSRYEIECIDTVRLTQDMESASDLFYDHPCLVVMDEVTAEKLENAVTMLYGKGYFGGLVPQPLRSPQFGGVPSARRFVGILTISLPDIARAYMTDKEWVRCEVTLPDGRQYEVELRTAFRLREDIHNLWARLGQSYYAKPGMIVVQDLIDSILEQTIQGCYENGFFERWVAQDGLPTP